MIKAKEFFEKLNTSKKATEDTLYNESIRLIDEGIEKGSSEYLSQGSIYLKGLREYWQSKEEEMSDKEVFEKFKDAVFERIEETLLRNGWDLNRRYELTANGDYDE